MSGLFPTFPEPNGYPEPADVINNTGNPLPTNSWMQNLFKGTVPPNIGGNNWTSFPIGSDKRRWVKPVPWFMSVDYTNQRFTFDHADTCDVIHSFNNGNNKISFNKDTQPLIATELKISNPNDLIITDLTDLGVRYKLFDQSILQITEVGIIRGSPFISFSTANELITPGFYTITLNFKGTIVNISSGNGRADITLIMSQRTLSTATYKAEDSNPNVFSVEVPYYNRYELISTIRADQLFFRDGLPFTGLVYGSIINEPNLILGRFVAGTFRPNIETVDYIVNQDGTTTIIWKRNGDAEQVEIVVTEPEIRVTYLKLLDIPTNVRPTITLFYTQNSSVDRSSPSSIQISSDIRGAFQFVMCLNDGNLIGNALPPNTLPGYISSLSQEFIPSSLGSYGFRYTSFLNPVYLYVPRLWESYNITAPFELLNKTIDDISYGTCRLYRFNAADRFIQLLDKNDLNVPLLPPGVISIDNAEIGEFPSLYVETLKQFKEEILRDIIQTYNLFDIESYRAYPIEKYGQVASTYGRLLLFYNILEFDLNAYTRYAVNFAPSIISWLNNTNIPEVNHINFESTWKGLITGANYETSLDPSNLSITFYNNSHIYFGRLVYAIYTLLFANIIPGNDFRPLFGRIAELMQTYIAYETNSRFIKSRNKEWYFGLSIGTGLSGESDLNQESVSAAINAYFASYLLSNLILSTYLIPGDPRREPFEKIQLSSVAALHSEMYAANLYWYSNGAKINTPSATIVSEFSLSYKSTTDSIPTSFPARALHNYTTIAEPLTEITPIIPGLVNNWIVRFATQSPRYQSANKQLIAGLSNWSSGSPNNGWEYTAIPSPYDNDNSETPISTADGFTGFQLLSLAGASADFTIQEASVYLGTITNMVNEMSQNPGPISSRFLNLYDSVSNGFYYIYLLTEGWRRLPGLSADSNGITSEINNPINDLTLINTNSASRNILMSSIQYNYYSNLLYNNIRHNSNIYNRPISGKWDRNDIMFQWPVGRILYDKCSPVAITETVPTIQILIEPTTDGEVDIGKVTYTIFDVVSYKNEIPYNSELNCLTTTATVGNTVITTFILNKDEANILPILNAEGSTFFNKSLALQAISPYLMLYSYAKLILARILYGRFDINFLRRRFNSKFFTDLSRTRFNKFIELFTSTKLINTNGLYFTIIGYGNAPQQGYLYFVE